MSALTAFALRQLAEKLRAEAESSYAMAKRIRAEQRRDERTGEMVDVELDAMYEIGHADGRNSLGLAVARQVEELARIVEGAGDGA
jgi:hypothetical protein